MNDTKTIPLEEPIQRGDNQITEIVVRKPKSGELRGTSLVNLLNMDYGALEIVVPRITTPALTKAEVIAMDPSDLVQIATEITTFLLTRQARDNLPTA